MVLYYLVQVMHSLWFIESRNVHYGALDSLKGILVFKDSSVKLHDFSQASLEGHDV